MIEYGQGNQHLMLLTMKFFLKSTDDRSSPTHSCSCEVWCTACISTVVTNTPKLHLGRGTRSLDVLVFYHSVLNLGRETVLTALSGPEVLTDTLPPVELKRKALPGSMQRYDKSWQSINSSLPVVSKCGNIASSTWSQKMSCIQEK